MDCEVEFVVAIGTAATAALAMGATLGELALSLANMNAFMVLRREDEGQQRQREEERASHCSRVPILMKEISISSITGGLLQALGCGSCT